MKSVGDLNDTFFNRLVDGFALGMAGIGFEYCEERVPAGFFIRKQTPPNGSDFSTSVTSPEKRKKCIPEFVFGSELARLGSVVSIVNGRDIDGHDAHWRKRTSPYGVLKLKPFEAVLKILLGDDIDDWVHSGLGEVESGLSCHIR